jgi:hypothetical protein
MMGTKYEDLGWNILTSLGRPSRRWKADIKI